ncbi:alpha/beta fold hydrolase [Oligoflexus tunisiensis]|uniref:alpha/beta fold hydrolase n=1 Tax=Oligoflexus tunisiensis TaxID=708132 RepID=UPI00114C9EBE|nr:alpha/beta hydrolase [Oligoflexus tunisiensis]
MVPIEIQLPHSRLVMQGFQSNPYASRRAVALHGWLDNCYTFRPLAELLPEVNIMAFDLPGHGDSSTLPEGVSYDFHQYLVWLHELIAALDRVPDFFLGHSMGAGIMSLYAGVFPERVSQLILIEGIGPLTASEAEAPRKMRSYIESWSQQGRLRNALYANREEAIRARQKNGPLSLEGAQTLAERGVETRGQGVVWKHDPRLKLPSRYQFSEGQALAYLGNITARTLYIEATQTIIPDNDLTRRRKQAIRNFEAVTLAGGHHLHLDDPEPVAAALRDFWKHTLT